MASFGDRRGSKKRAAEGKISLRLIEFAEPMVAEAFEGDGDPTPADLERVLISPGPQVRRLMPNGSRVADDRSFHAQATGNSVSS